jgi:hypothetical protein
MANSYSNLKTEMRDGDLYFLTSANLEICHFSAASRMLVVPSGSAITAPSSTFIVAASGVLGVATGYYVSRGFKAGTATPTFVTGLASILGWSAVSVAGNATAANTCAKVTAKPAASTPGSLVVKRWKHTAPSTATYVAATVAGTVAYVAVGTK